MTYMIRGAAVGKGSGRNYLIRDRKIAYSGQSLNCSLNTIALNCEGFYIAPARVAVDESILEIDDFSRCKEKFIELQRQGVTTILAICQVERERDLKRKLKEARHRLINSSLDYVIGISFPMRKITPDLVRLCRRERVPCVFASIESEEDLGAVTWAWIRDALFWYRLAILPDWRKLSDMPPRKQTKLHKKWRKLADTFDIPTMSDIPRERSFLQKDLLRKIGVSPYKGELKPGSDLDYNLFESRSLADPMELHYDKNRFPDVVVLRGRLMKAGKTVYFRPGFGKEVSVRVPGYLTFYPEGEK